VFIHRMYPNGLPADTKGIGIGKKWRHEDGSVRMLRHLVKENGIEWSAFGLQDLDVLFIEEIISGTPEDKRQGRLANKFFLYGKPCK
jgi:hypothetical protein